MLIKNDVKVSRKRKIIFFQFLIYFFYIFFLYIDFYYEFWYFYYIFVLQKKALASDLYEQVFYSLDLIEKDYFGLQYTDSNNVQHWLDPTKPIKKQVKSMFFAYLYSFSFLFIK